MQDIRDGNQAEEILQQVKAAAESITGLEPIWKRGLVHHGGPHYRLRGTLGPIGIGEDECLILGKVVSHFRPQNCFIIGNAFGLSSTFITKMMELHEGISVVTLDNMAEANGDLCFQVAEQLRLQMNCRILTNQYGHSPEDIDKAVGSKPLDLIFIDGDHSDPQVTKDFLGLHHLIGDQSIVCWHDYWMEGVAKSVAVAERSGLRCLKLNSSSEIVLGTRDEGAFLQIQSIFRNGEPPRWRKRLLPLLRLSCTHWWSVLKSPLTRNRRSSEAGMKK